MYGEPDEGPDEIRILGFSQERLDRDVQLLTAQKHNLRDIMERVTGGSNAHPTAGMHAYPLVAKIDGGKIVEYNIAATIPKSWIINPDSGEIDKTQLPELKFATPFRHDGVTIDQRKIEELSEAIGLNPDEAHDEWLAHQAHHIVHNTELIAVTEKVTLLRNRDGVLQRGAVEDDLPPLGTAGHVPVPPPSTPASP